MADDRATLEALNAELQRARQALLHAVNLLNSANLTFTYPLPVPPPPAAPSAPPPPHHPPPAANPDATDWALVVAIVAIAAVLLLAAVLAAPRLRKAFLSLRPAAATPLIAPAPAEGDSDLAEATRSGREAEAARKVADRQRLLDQLAGMRGCESFSPGDEASAVDVDEAVSRVGNLDAALLAAVTRGAGAREVRALLASGASPNAAFLDRCALTLAVRNCEAEVTRSLLEADAFIDKKDTRGWTPLMHAVDAHSTSYSREAVLLLLLDAGAAVDVWGHDLRGPLDLMVAKQQQQLSTADTTRASHITASKITMLMHQKSGTAGTRPLAAGEPSLAKRAGPSFSHPEGALSYSPS
ncbi:hypothetical protein AB1Y20_022719 [Prymnesium parvum]|uniref:Uncharacterized protein n=1 Tax=Prymnesium parvum TaxID=97485 RepID=A0AB34JH48_PRYPA